jgi:Flp pilus assembly protein TadB
MIVPVAIRSPVVIVMVVVMFSTISLWAVLGNVSAADIVVAAAVVAVVVMVAVLRERRQRQKQQRRQNCGEQFHSGSSSA